MVPAVMIGAIVVALGAVTAFAIPRVALGRPASQPAVRPIEADGGVGVAPAYVTVDD